MSYYLSEHQRFKRTIERGHKELVKLLQQNKGASLSGKQILQLEKKYGLPAILTEKFLHNQGLLFLKDKYEDELIKWKSNATRASFN